MFEWLLINIGKGGFEVVFQVFLGLGYIETCAAI